MTVAVTSPESAPIHLNAFAIRIGVFANLGSYAIASAYYSFSGNPSEEL